ncbi:hypothetical protein L950_0221860 [Sphingobacterium sp. IITKGP-BTPF85]|nr:hypothetical protein L950_0221860 [Sphingobacterium sp. IITKGP-BTPF85]
MIPCGITLALLFVWGVQLLWNVLMPEIFGLKIISFWQAFGLLLLSKILLVVLDLKAVEVTCVMDMILTTLHNSSVMRIDPDSKQNGNVDFQQLATIGIEMMMKLKSSKRNID